MRFQNGGNSFTYDAVVLAADCLCIAIIAAANANDVDRRASETNKDVGIRQNDAKQTQE
jgi:hypothetical protein